MLYPYSAPTSHSQLLTILQAAYFTSSSSGVSRNAARQALSSRTTHNSSGSTAVMAGVEGVVVTPVLPNAYLGGSGQPPTTSSGSSQVGILLSLGKSQNGVKYGLKRVGCPSAAQRHMASWLLPALVPGDSAQPVSHTSLMRGACCSALQR